MQDIDIDARERHPAYLQQMARAYRFLDRYKAIGNISIESEPERMNDLEDFLWAFFQNCWHIKDWIRNDESLPKTVREAVWEDVNCNKALLVVADLANGIKHFSRDAARERVGADFGSIIVNENGDGVLMLTHEVSVGDDMKRSALAVAEEAMNAWNEILFRHGMSGFTNNWA